MLPSSRHQICQCVRQIRRGSAPSLRRQPVYRRTFATSQRQQSQTTANPIRNTQTLQEQNAKAKRSAVLSAAGLVVCAVAMYGVVKFYFPQGLEDNKKKAQEAAKDSASVKLDAPARFGGDSMPLVLDGVEQVPTENGAIPYFPKKIRVPRSLEANVAGQQIGAEVSNESGEEEEYTLLGLGIRSVSFLSIQVYVVGLYVAKSDIPALQQLLIKQAASPVVRGVPPTEGAMVASSLVPGERENLKNTLLDAEKGEIIWADMLKESGIRSALRIVPTRNTDFLHLRDGWVRAITGRAQQANAHAKELAKQSPDAPPSEFADDSFGNAMGDFKALLGAGVRKNVPKGHTLLLLRDKVGGLDILYDQGEKQPTVWMGHVADERLTRLLWINYLAGKTVASESARKNIIDGVINIVARPIGTVE